MVKRILIVGLAAAVVGLAPLEAAVPPLGVATVAARQAGLGALAVGSAAWVSTGAASLGLRVHAGPGLASPQVESLTNGTEVRVLAGPVAVDGYGWYEVSAAGLAGPGWVDGAALSSVAPGQSGAAPGPAVNSAAWVAGTGGQGLRVHAAPGIQGPLVGSLAEGSGVRVLEGPVPSDGLPWYLVSAAPLAVAGWVDGNLLTAAAPPPPAPPAVAIGHPAWVAGTGGLGLRVHSAPALRSDVAGELGAGTEAQVLEGPVTADGHNWYRVSVPGLPGGGWVAGGYLSAAPPAAIVELGTA
jgi:Bacterial SH3 domain